MTFCKIGVGQSDRPPPPGLNYFFFFFQSGELGSRQSSGPRAHLFWVQLSRAPFLGALHGRMVGCTNVVLIFLTVVIFMVVVVEGLH